MNPTTLLTHLHVRQIALAAQLENAKRAKPSFRDGTDPAILLYEDRVHARLDELSQLTQYIKTNGKPNYPEA